MTDKQAGALGILFLIGLVLTIFWPSAYTMAWRELLARWLLIAAIVCACAWAVLPSGGCAGPEKKRVPVELLMDPLPPLPVPCPGGHPDPTQEYGCAFPDSTG